MVECYSNLAACAPTGRGLAGMPGGGHRGGGRERSHHRVRVCALSTRVGVARGSYRTPFFQRLPTL